MKFTTMAKILIIGLAVFALALEVGADDPIFVKWLVIDDPGDETIRTYWERAENGELGPKELVDLGTMLFYRGWSGDAVKYFREALDQDPELTEAWFRTGLVKHRDGDLAGARSAYKKCLKRQSGHGWGNFYLGLLEEQTGDATAALEHYQEAFRHAPELADPRVNPEILSSKLQMGAQVRYFDGQRFEGNMPMPYLDPAQVTKVRRQYEKEPPPKPEPTAEPTTASGQAESYGESSGVSSQSPRSGSVGGAAAAGAATGPSRNRGGSTTTLPSAEETPYGMPTPGRHGGGSGTVRPSPQIGSTSPEARVRPLWPGLHELVEAFV